jgi:CheY-like chemotaxis protein
VGDKPKMIGNANHEAVETMIELDPPRTAPVILLVEDNEDTVIAVGDYLEFKGLRVVVARTGHEALAFCVHTTPVAILMDIQMPGMSGIEAIQALRRRSATANTPTIAVTALAMPGDRDRCLHAGANAYMSKPLQMRRLFEMIQEYGVQTTV